MSLATLSLGDAAARGWDAVVVGAGPCGSIAARAMALRGMSVLLVEKAELPRAKVCGGCLAQGGIRILDRLGLGHALDGAPALHQLDAWGFGRRASIGVCELRGIDRTRMDETLARAAIDAGAGLLDGSIARVRANGVVELRQVELTEFVQAKTVVVADGVGGGSLASEPRFAWTVTQDSKVGVGAVVHTRLDLPDHAIVMCIGRSGYVGLAPVQGGGTAIAAAVRPAAVSSEGGLARTLQSIVNESGIQLHLPSQLSLRGTAQLTRHRRCVELDRVLVAGDAAGYVEPFTGEGMTWALRSGELVAAIAAQRTRGQLSSGAWTKMIRRELSHAKRRCAVVAGVLDRPWLVRATLATADAAPRLTSALSSGFGRTAQERVA